MSMTQTELLARLAQIHTLASDAAAAAAAGAAVEKMYGRAVLMSHSTNSRLPATNPPAPRGINAVKVPPVKSIPNGTRKKIIIGILIITNEAEKISQNFL
jgi:hypothetical protein